MSGLFDSTAYYKLSSDLYGGGTVLSDGYSPGTPASLLLGTVSYSSENWQVFFQEGIYFIRNYDFGAVYQLGISDVSATQPQLLPSSGELSQQWNITLWSDGTRKLTNMAVGDFQMLSVSNNSAGSIIAVMNTAEAGSHWTFDINSSAGQATSEMLQSLSSIATVTSTALSSPSSSTGTSSAAPSETSSNTSSKNPLSSSTISLGAASTIPLISTTAADGIATSISTNSQASPSANLSNTSPTMSSHNTLSTGALAGIIIAGIAVVAVIVLLSVFLFRKRKGERAYQDLPPSDSLVTGLTPSHYAPPSYSTAREKSAMQTQPVELKAGGPPVELFAPQKSRMPAEAAEMP